MSMTLSSPLSSILVLKCELLTVHSSCCLSFSFPFLQLLVLQIQNACFNLLENKLDHVLILAREPRVCLKIFLNFFVTVHVLLRFCCIKGNRIN